MKDLYMGQHGNPPSGVVLMSCNGASFKVHWAGQFASRPKGVKLNVINVVQSVKS